jgi:hypothetical protein
LVVQHPLTARREAPPTGVIETLSAGYAALNRQLWVLLLPVALNVFLWLGPHVSYAPLVDPAVTDATQWTRQVAFGQRRVVRNPDVLSQLEQTRQQVIAHTDDVNGLDALTWGPLPLPSVQALPSSGADDPSFVTSWLDGGILLAACAALGLILGGWFYGGVALASSGVKGGPADAGRNVLRAVRNVLGLVAVQIGAAILLGLPLVLLIVFVALVSPAIAILGLALLLVGLLFAAVHLFFAVDAIFVSNAGPLSAIQRSVVLVRKHLWQSVALFVLTWLILAGMGRVWDVLASSLQSPFGVLLGILGNAYVASGLIAAGMIFYTQHSEANTQWHYRTNP